MKDLLECSAYDWDIKLLEKLGLKIFKNIPLQKRIKLGTVKIAKQTDENFVLVNVFVEGWPAQFWSFEITLKSTYDKKQQNILIGTGSGCFSDYWKKLYPLFKELASGMITIK